ncbi:alpha/beta hydrolase family protein [Spongiivirga citrea]|uniref:Alpha/beta hydrolase n=1 Tax=Spongiivirga citrea TaxID=1481457 RepID=A0A6M0CMG5_9FLAO|nr:alpha/beta hydrolase [Spongiivirga citrea]NER19126.1 alpha/beta hydrolase [Spongiivirga citrea]
MIARITIIIVSLVLSAITNAQSIKEEDILLKNNEIELPGTLSYLEETNKQILVIFVHGSGNIDRNGNQTGMSINANYIKQLSDSLVNKGIAFYRYDKRTSNPKNIPIMLKNGIKFNELASDVRVVINHFKDDKRFNKIILVGHSQGSLVSMLAMNDHIDKFISLAGPSETIEDAIVRQVGNQSEELAKVATQHFSELKKTDTILSVNQMLANIFAPQNQAFLKDYNRYNPMVMIKSMTIPILLINGDLDLQVRVKDAELLHESNPDSELVIISKMNHVLKTIEDPAKNQQSYFSPDFPLSQKLVNTLVEFIKK